MSRYQPFRKKRSYLLAVILILAALGLSFYGTEKTAVIRPALNSIIYPFQYAANSIWQGITGAPSVLAALRNQVQENAALKEKLDSALAQLNLLEELKLENSRLHSALGFKGGSRFGLRLSAAQMVAKNGSIFVINRGSLSGVKINTPAIVKAGLVGKVIEVSPYSSKVMAITDPLSQVAAADQRTRDYGVAEGRSPYSLSLRYVSTAAEIMEGDPVVTASISTIFPPGISVGKVSRAEKKDGALFYDIIVTPAVDFSKLEEIFLVI